MNNFLELENFIKEIVQQYVDEMKPVKELISPEEKEQFQQNKKQIQRKNID